MAYTLYLLAAFGGVIAGFMSTLAGLGSVVTLYILIDIIQLDPNVANGTNRIGIMAMCLMALPEFHKKGHLNLLKNKEIILTLFVGAIGGVSLALNVNNNDFKRVISSSQ